MSQIMTILELKLDLPDQLAQDAEKMGLLEPDKLQALLREAVRNRRIAQLAEARAPRGCGHSANEHGGDSSRGGCLPRRAAAA